MKGSRFVDTTLKVTELEHLDRVYEQEIDDEIYEKEQELLKEEFYDTTPSDKRDGAD